MFGLRQWCSRPLTSWGGVWAISVTLALGACGGHPDENSGGDAYRNESQPMPLDEWVTGQLDLDNGDATDWKVVSVDGAGKLQIELKADKKSAVVHVGVYDKHGQSLGDGTRKAGADEVKVPVKAAAGGQFFVRIVHKDGAKTAYSVRAVMGDEGGGDAVPDL